MNRLIVHISFLRLMETVGRVGTADADAERGRLKCGQPPGELRLTQRHLQPEARGLAIMFDDDRGCSQS